MECATVFPEGFERVKSALSALAHPHAPLWLEVPARTSLEAATALGVTVAQIAKSVVFRRVAAGVAPAPGVAAAAVPEVAVLVVTSGDQRVDERRVAALVCEPGRSKLARADAEFVKARTGFSIGGVAPLAHSEPPVILIDRELFRFEEIWAAAGHPNGVFKLAPADLPRLTGGAPVADVVQRPEGSAQ